MKHGLRPVGVGLGLIADSLKAVDAVFQRRVVQIGNACLDSVIEPLEAQFRFCGALVQLGDMLAAALGMFFPPVERGGKDSFQPLGLEKLLLKVIGDQIVQLFHRHGHALAGGRPLPRLHRAGIVAVAPALAGADGHGSTALGAMDQAGEHGRAADDGGRRDLGIAGLEQLLHGVERVTVDDRRDGNHHDFTDRLQFLGLGPLIEFVFAHIGAAGGRSGDDGIDGVIDQDALGLDRVYIQAKRYAVNNSVGPGAIRDFFGSLDRHKATKGLFVTTSTFTGSARETAEYLSKRIVLIDGEHLARLMIRHNVGCRVEEVLHVKRIDEDFFE